MNDAQKLDAILKAQQNPPAATVDTAALSAAIVAALKPSFDAITASLADIQGELDEPSSGSGSSASGTATPAVKS